MLWTGLVLCAAAVLETPPFYLRRARFEPKQWMLPVSFRLAERLDEARVREAAGRVRQQLVDQGYVDAKVDARLVAVDVHQADLVLRVESGPLYRRGNVRFTGDLGMEPGELRRAMRGSRPGDLEADLARLRTLYLSRGYAGARVRAAEVRLAGGKEDVEVAVDAGPRGRRGRTCAGVCAPRGG
jgi:outer membrane protein assembly factor BamA